MVFLGSGKKAEMVTKFHLAIHVCISCGSPIIYFRIPPYFSSQPYNHIYAIMQPLKSSPHTLGLPNILFLLRHTQDIPLPSPYLTQFPILCRLCNLQLEEGREGTELQTSKLQDIQLCCKKM
jgi:hypothetical protein